MNIPKYISLKNALNEYQSKHSKKGASMVEKIILLVVALFVAAFTLPSAFTAIATTALTSVNSAVATLFQQLVPIIAVVAIVLLIYYETKEARTG